MKAPTGPNNNFWIWPPKAQQKTAKKQTIQIFKKIFKNYTSNKGSLWKIHKKFQLPCNNQSTLLEMGKGHEQMFLKSNTYTADMKKKKPQHNNQCQTKQWDIGACVVA